MTLKPVEPNGRTRIEAASPNPPVEEGLQLLAAFLRIASPEKRAEAIAFVSSLTRPH